MAVPKKRMSKSKKNSRLAQWNNKANLQSKKALSLAKSIFKGVSNSFFYPSSIEKESDHISS
uniref:Large ribosomal subunit protein bL32c n=1 Tax=Cryptomonas sp. SAG 977-2f TaxID=279061 RepID=A0A679CA52_9CRYP|nr:ribosomal protein L32 [Cryptomonas sp. SAG 977-2f]